MVNGMFPQLSDFGFRALWSPYFLIFTLLIIGLFFYLGIKKRDRFPGSEPLQRKQSILFIFAIFFLYIVLGSPIDLLGHLMFTFHMVQMAFLLLFIPPLLIISIPVWMWKKALSYPFIRMLFKIFAKPLVALIMFNGLFSFYHVPFIFDTVKTNVWLHALYNTILFISALFMWWPLVNKIEDEPKFSGLKKVGYIYASGALMTPACALIIFSNGPLFETYTNTELWLQSLVLCVPPDQMAAMSLPGPELFNPMSPIHDQQLGGILMKILQEIFYMGILLRVFIEWYHKDQNEPDPVVSFQKNDLIKE